MTSTGQKDLFLTLDRGAIMTSTGQKDLFQQVLPKLRPFQREAVEFATKGTRYNRQCHDDCTKTPIADPSLLGKGRILLADEMGLGKSVTSLAIMSYYQDEWPLLVLCPASLRYTWPSEIEKFFPTISPSSIYVAKGFQDIGFVKQKDMKVLILTYSLFQERSAVQQALKTMEFKCIIADESHNLKSRTSQRSQLVLPLLLRASRLVLLSGTPALARPSELWTQLSVLAPKLFGTWSVFSTRYCDPKRKSFGRGRFVTDYSGSSNQQELHQKLQHVMVRRLKCDVLKELPPKQRSIVPVNIPVGEDLSKCKRIMAEMSEKKVRMEDMFGDTRKADFEAKALLMQAYQASGIGKAHAVGDYLVDWLTGSGTQKILVFAHHKEVLDRIDKILLSKCPNAHIRIDGSVPTQIRSQLVRRFQTCERIRVALLSVTAAGVGLTLTAASTVLFAELHWTPGVLAQAEDRAHRIGQQHDSVNIVYMVCKNTNVSLDMVLWKMLGRKINTLGQVVDGKTETPCIYNANESESHEVNGVNEQSRSALEEVTSFFAESSKTKSKEKNTKPSKGSIESFFHKAASLPRKKSDAGSSNKRKEIIDMSSEGGEEIEISCDTCTLLNTCNIASSWHTCGACGNLIKVEDNRKKKARRDFSKGTNTNGQETTGTFKWKCMTCTLENEMVIAVSGWYTCEACLQPFATDDDCSSETDTLLAPSSLNLVKRRKKQRDKSSEQASSFGPETSINEGKKVNTCSSREDAHGTEDSPSEKKALLSTPSLNLKHTTFSSAVPTAVSVSTRKSLKTPSARQKSASAAEDIEFLGTSSGVSARTPAVSTKSRYTSSPEVIEIDSDSDEESTKSTNDHRYSEIVDAHMDNNANILAFSVSKHSGRITICDAKSGTSLLVSFSLEDILIDETLDSLFDAKAKKASWTTQALFDVSFDRAGISTVLDLIDKTDVSKRTMEKNLTTFVTNYLRLRPIEQQTLKESCKSFVGDQLSQTIAKMMVSEFNDETAKRYSGGAKERAKKHAENGVASEQDKNVLEGKACAWCGELLPYASLQSHSTYCSEECANEGRIRRGGQFASCKIRRATFALEGGKCALCDFNAHAFYQQICALAPAERLNKLLSVNWTLPKSKKALDSLLHDPKEGNFWQVDHIRAVAEGGGSCGMANLRTLCVPCHSKETEKLRGRLKLQGHFSEKGKDKEQQVDIRSSFQLHKAS